MTDEQLQRIHDIEYSCDSRAELAERIVGLENESATLVIKLNAEHIVRQNVEAENAKLREERDMYRDLVGCMVHPDIPDQLAAENAKLRELVDQMYRDMQGVLDMSADTVFVDSIGTLRDKMDLHMQTMAELGMPPADYESRMRELGIEVSDD